MPFQIPPVAESHCKFRLWNCPSYSQDGETAGLHKAIINIKRSRRQAVTALNIIVIANYPFEKHYILASLVKGRWIDGKAQALILLLSVCDTPTFFYLSNFSAVKTEGLLYTHQPFHPHNPLKATSTTLPHTTLPKPHYPLAFCNANICMCRYAFASAPSFASHQHPCLPCQR